MQSISNRTGSSAIYFESDRVQHASGAFLFALDHILRGSLRLYDGYRDGNKQAKLKKLDKLSESVTDWKEFNKHEVFKEQIIEAHGHKRSFWSRYVK